VKEKRKRLTPLCKRLLILKIFTKNVLVWTEFVVECNDHQASKTCLVTIVRVGPPILIYILFPTAINMKCTPPFHECGGGGYALERASGGQTVIYFYHD
jgi:hypothetical protein